MKKLFLLLILSFFSAQSFAGSCPDGSEPVKTVSADGSYYEFNCADNSSGIDDYGGASEIPGDAYPNYETLKYYLYKYLYGGRIEEAGQKLYEVKASSNPYKFQFNLREDNYVKKQLQETALLSYLLYEDDKIVIDEITPKDRFGDMFIESSKYGSASLGKSLVSYVTGHAICAGYIESVDTKLDDWPLIQNTLYHNQKLIDLLNMAAGDQAYVDGMSGYLTNSRRWINNQSITSIMKNELRNSKKSNSQYNYNNLATNTIGTYVVFKSGDSFQNLLDDIFKNKVRIEDDVFFRKNQNANFGEETFWYHFYATRSDYLRIAKAMLDDWQNDTCEGQYLKTIYKKRINKNRQHNNFKSAHQNPQYYGGQFHMGYQGMQNRPVIGMNGAGGQGMLIDFERGRIVATQAIHENYNWVKLVHMPIRDGKPASKSPRDVKQVNEIILDPQQLIQNRKVRRETESKAKAFWDNYYQKIFHGFGSSMNRNDEVLEYPYADEASKVETLDSDPTVSKVIEATQGDKFIVDIAEPNELAGTNIKIGLKDIDAPDAIKSCPKQMELGKEVRDYVAQRLENASIIKLTNFRKTNTKIIAQVIIDGIDLGEELVSKGYASKEYGYWMPYFCSPSMAYGLGNQLLNIDGNSAIFWYERAMILDPDSPTKTIATFNLHKLYGGVDEVKSIENLKKSAALEYMPAMEELGSAYLNGDGVKKDSYQGKKWLKKAFDNGSPIAEGIYCSSLPKAQQKSCKF
jgi:endonuclease YncB( thermonuclease family)